MFVQGRMRQRVVSLHLSALPQRNRPMCSAMRRVALAATTAAMMFTYTTRALSQADTTGQWRYTITPYAWLTGLSGQVGVGPVASNIDLGVSDVLDMLKFGI